MLTATAHLREFDLIANRAPHCAETAGVVVEMVQFVQDENKLMFFAPEVDRAAMFG